MTQTAWAGGVGGFGICKQIPKKKDCSKWVISQNIFKVSVNHSSKARGREAFNSTDGHLVLGSLTSTSRFWSGPGPGWGAQFKDEPVLGVTCTRSFSTCTSLSKRFFTFGTHPTRLTLVLAPFLVTSTRLSTRAWHGQWDKAAHEPTANYQKLGSLNSSF